MKFKPGAAVEVAGEGVDDQGGFEESWWAAKVVREVKKKGKTLLVVRVDEMLEEDGVTHVEAAVEPKLVRPPCPDDSLTKPLAQRSPGEGVDCWHEDGWWEGVVHQVYDDHISVYFPRSGELYDDIFPPKQPLDPDAHRVRTGKNWDTARAVWEYRLRKTYAGAGDFRSAAPQRAPQPSSSSSGSDGKPPLLARRAAPPAAKRAGAAAQQAKQQPKQQPKPPQQQPKPPQPAKPPQQPVESDSGEVPLLKRKPSAGAAKQAGAADRPHKPAPSKKQHVQQQQPVKPPPPPQRQLFESSSRDSELDALFGRKQAGGAAKKAGKAKEPQLHQQPAEAATPRAAAVPADATSSDEELPLSQRPSSAGGKQPAAQPTQRPQQASPVAAAAQQKPPTGAAAAASAAAAAAAAAAISPAKDPYDLPPTPPSSSEGSEMDVPLSARKAAASPADKRKALAAAPAQQQQQQRPAAPRKPETAPAAAQKPAPAAAAPRPPAAAGPAAAAGKAAGTAAAQVPGGRAASEPPGEAGLQAARHTVGDLLTSLDAGSSEEDGAPLLSPASATKPAAPAPPAAPLAAAAPATAAAPAAAAAEPPAAAGRGAVPTVQTATAAAPAAKGAQPAAPAEAKAAAPGVGEPGLAAAAKQPKQQEAAKRRRPAEQQQQQQREGEKRARQQDVQQPQRAQPQAVAAAQPKRQQPTKQPGRGGSKKAVPAAAPAAPFVIPKRAAAGGGDGTPGGTPVSSPRHPKRDAAAAAAAPGQQQPKQSRLGGEAHAAAAAPAAAALPLLAGAPGSGGARIPKVQPSPQGADDAPPDFPTTFCLDNLPPGVTTATLRAALQGELGVRGLKNVEAVTVPLDAGDRASGYAVLRFASRRDAHRHYEALKSLCVVTPTCPVPRPLILSTPRHQHGYSWGPDERLPGHFPLQYRANQHFAQPNSIEFDLAIDWRQLGGVLAAAKAALCAEQAAALAAQLAGVLKASGKPQPAIDAQRLRLPGEQPLGGGGGSAAAAFRRTASSGADPESCCVWLTGVPVAVGERQLVEAFSQFGHPQKAQVVRDPVTGLPSGHAVLWMESPQRARDLTQNLREMVYMLNGTPRAVEASVAVPGPPTGSQSVYDRALRCVFGKDDTAVDAGELRFVQVPDALVLREPAGGLAPELHAAVALRHLLRAHRQEQGELARAKRERQAALDAKQQQHFAHEKGKLGRLAAIQLVPGPTGKDNLIQELAREHGLKTYVYKNTELAKWACERPAARAPPPAQPRGARRGA